MNNPSLEGAAPTERDRDETASELAGVTRQRDELKRQLDIALEQNLAMRRELKKQHS